MKDPAAESHSNKYNRQGLRSEGIGTSSGDPRHNSSKRGSSWVNIQQQQEQQQQREDCQGSHCHPSLRLLLGQIHLWHKQQQL